MVHCTSTFATTRFTVTATAVVPDTIFAVAVPVITNPPERMALVVTFA